MAAYWESAPLVSLSFYGEIKWLLEEVAIFPEDESNLMLEVNALLTTKSLRKGRRGKGGRTN